MKEQILNIGKGLKKGEQILITGGNPMLGDECSSYKACYLGPIQGDPYAHKNAGCPVWEECVEFDFGAVCQCIQ